MKFSFRQIVLLTGIMQAIFCKMDQVIPRFC